ncbi:hypothetical protein [Spiroplasma culicicola]|uniref:Uncharacterized protein n=1 Tax=Spiroplasma culicicola AES-1 TaxID=1276246 RepID=W6A883_9MOLU|nr:hypothetical protein [Spiroplasma culicicola]AHI53363.1 hypothetical protein SCULI_v1c10230 [Spiroplasma culicicola AES-1]
MYVNPFERMRKKREEAEKLQEEAVREREKYARLGAQMGLTQEKGVMPSFIKSLIGETNQTKVPPFGMGVGSDDSGAGPFGGMGGDPFAGAPMDSGPAPSFSSSMEATPLPTSFETPGSMPSFDSGPAPSFGASMPMESVPSVPSFEQAPPMSAPQMSEPVISPTQQPMFESSSTVPNFGSVVDSGPAPSFSSSGNAPSFEQAPLMNETIATQVPPSFDSGPAPNFGASMPMESVPSVPSFEQAPPISAPQMSEPIMQPIQESNLKPNQVTTATFISMLNQNNVQGKLFVLMGGDTNLQTISDSFVSQLSQEQKNLIDTEEAHLYGAPFLFLLKQIVNILPVINLDDKRVLWEKTSLLLAATDYGKTGSEVDEILEDFAIENPIERIQQEFMQVFEAYGLNAKQLLIMLRGFNTLELTQTTKTVQFINQLFNQLINLKFVFEFSESFVIGAQATDAGGAMLSQINGYIIYGQEMSQTSNNSFEPVNNPLPQSDTTFASAMPEQPIPSFEQAPPMSAPQMNNPSSTFETQIPSIPEPSPMPDIGASISEPSFSPSFQPETGPSMMAAPGGFEPMGASSTDMPPGMSFGFPSSLELEEEEPEEEYDSGLDNNVRIRVDLNLQKKQEEQEEREKKEEQERIERMGGHGFNPAILADSKTNNMFTQPKRVNDPLDVNKATIMEHKKIEDPRDFETIKGKLNELTKEHQSKAGINIQESFAVKENKNQNLIDVPGNWTNINNK